MLQCIYGIPKALLDQTIYDLGKLCHTRNEAANPQIKLRYGTYRSKRKFSAEPGMHSVKTMSCPG